tara:strand:- start:2196 stop:2426 length:231 start_codon:yes stop_codon:yes gene_type:complete
MTSISELRTEAQSKGQELIKRFQELENAEKQIVAEKAQIKTQVDLLNGEINAYNKIEPPTQDAPNEAPPNEAPVEN